MQAGGELEMAEMIGRELKLVTARRECELRDGHHAGVVDQDVERPVPTVDERGDRRRIGELQAPHVDGTVACRRADGGGYRLAGGDVTDGERDLGAVVGQDPRGLDADPR